MRVGPGSPTTWHPVGRDRGVEHIKESACQPSAGVGVHGRAITSARASHASGEGGIRLSANTKNLLQSS